jgi:hypothetical protein
MPHHPPAVTPLSTAAINDATMPAALFRSYARLYAAAWRHDYRRTDPLDFDAQLIPLLGVSRAQARQHLRLLRFAKMIDWSSDGQNRYVIRFLPRSESGITDSVVGVVGILNHSIDLQHQQHRSGKPDSGEAGAEAGVADDEAYQTALRWLERAGVWADAARRIAAQIAANERAAAERAARDEAVPPGGCTPLLGDVLGWTAYCFSDREKSRVQHPAAVLAANLNAGRCCPDEYLPPAVCAACGVAEEYCDCPDGPRPHYPDAFLERALQPKDMLAGYRKDRWGVCLSCRAFPCQCGEE